MTPTLRVSHTHTFPPEAEARMWMFFRLKETCVVSVPTLNSRTGFCQDDVTHDGFIVDTDGAPLACLHANSHHLP